MTDIRNQILTADDIPFEDVPVEEWGVTIRIQGLSTGQRADYVEGGMDESGERVKGWFKAATPRLLIATIVDPETGEPVFTDDDAEFILKKNALVTDRLAKIAGRLSGLGNSEEAQEDEEKTEAAFR